MSRPPPRRVKGRHREPAAGTPLDNESADDTQDTTPSAARTLSIIGASAAALIAAMYFAIGPWTGVLSIDAACNSNIPRVPDGAGVTYTSQLHLGWRPHWTCEYRIGGQPVSVDVGWAAN